MPKETFKTGEHATDATVHVNWGRDQEYVQIATTGWYVGQELPDEVGLYATLDEKQVDDLVKVLKKAKRQAWAR